MVKSALNARQAGKSAKGFTLVELLVVIALVAILAAVVLLIIKPLEIMRQGRDSTRMADLAGLQNAINVAVQEATISGNAILCDGATYPCNGLSTDANARSKDGTGWVKVNLGASSAITVPTLPVDPVNNATFHYVYCADDDNWEVNTVLESEKFQGNMANDGGDNDNRLESGSLYDLVDSVSGCTY